MPISKKEKTQTRRLFMLEHFFKDAPDQHTVKEVGDLVLVKYWEGTIGEWGVAVYTKESYKKSQENYELFKKGKL